jgi:hypothetical protein
MRPKATFLVTVLILVSAVLGSVSAEGPAVRSFATPTQAVATCGIYCGTERWSVKTLSDADRDKVQLAPKEVTVEWLISQKPQARLPTDRRVTPIETQTYKIRAFLVAYKLEADQDFHVVIADVEDPSKTMIAEVPSPECAGACASGHAEEFRIARAVIAGLPEPVPPVIVVVTGVGFFDFLHGQTGAAPNGIELHPVLKIELESGSAPPSSSPSQASAEGEKSEVKVWVNTRSGVYHCPGSRWYGDTKQGKFMGECEAKKAGYRPAHDRPCASSCL